MRESSKRHDQEPSVGIFWIVGGKLLIDSSALSEAEAYGDFKTHSDDHIVVWEKLQRKGVAPAAMEYEEAPRGRVVYNTKTRQFTMLADECNDGATRVLRACVRFLSVIA
jgi:hypothetical protein